MIIKTRQQVAPVSLCLLRSDYGLFYDILFRRNKIMSRSKDSFTDIEINEMIRLHNEGKYNHEIADLFETSKTMVARIF